MIISINGYSPKIGAGCFIAENAVVAGNVAIGDNCSIWFGAVIRAEKEQIVIEENTNIQDNCVIHVDTNCPVHIGKNVSVGHSAVLHGCTVEDESMVGMHATVLNKASIGKGSLVAAGALVSGGKEFEDYSLIIGAPAVRKSELSDKARRELLENVQNYLEFKDMYKGSK